MLELLLTLGMLAVDQLTKVWAAGPLATTLGGSVPVIPGVFSLTYVENRGMAFGLLQNKKVFFIVLTLAVCAALLWVMVKKRKEMNLWIRIALAFILSGAVGNLIDRAMLGYVRDMLDFCLIHFPVFNVADSCICVGAALLVIGVFLLDRQEKKAAAEKAAQEIQAEPAQTLEEKQEEPAQAEAVEHSAQTSAEGEPKQQ